MHAPWHLHSCWYGSLDELDKTGIITLINVITLCSSLLSTVINK